MRITELEYKFNKDPSLMSEREFIQEIERIYLEEIGEKLPATISVYTSTESEKMKNEGSGYDGTAIHFSAEEEGINEVYIVSQGSQDGVDWPANIESMLAGQSIAQAQATQDFTVDALEEFGIEVNENKMEQVEVPVVGLSHSLAHNNNTTSYLLYDTFSKVHSVNGAQTNYYQLFFRDRKFNQRLIESFPALKVDSDTIYSLPPADIEAIAQDFYADKAENIYQDISVHDPLYAVSGVRGFFTLGDVKYHETSENHQGLREIADKIPDEAVIALQSLAIDYTVAKENATVEDIIKDLSGIDMKVIEKFDGFWGSVTTYFGNEFTEMLPSVNEKLPGLIENIQLITGNSKVIFDELLGASYITKEQRDELVDTFMAIEKELLAIQTAFESIELYRNMEITHGEQSMGLLGADMGAGGRILLAVNRLVTLINQLNKEEYQNILNIFVDSHGIGEMLNALNGEKKRYLNGDLLLAPTVGGGGQDIWVNISAALRMYTEGKVILEERTEEISRLEATIDEEITQFFEDEKQRLADKINDIEQNSSAYVGMVQKHTASTVKGVQRITVFDDVDASLGVNHDPEIEFMQLSVTDGYNFIEIYRKAIEDMFDAEAQVAERFKLAELICID